MTARILIVDDTPLNLKLLAAKLTRDYYIVTTAENGPDALAKIDLDPPDIVLLDVMMPEMDGFEVCRRIKADPQSAHIPVVMLTALSDVTDRVTGLEAGADDFLTKPINDVALMSRVRSLLRLKMIMDEWRLREKTSSQFISRDAVPPPPSADIKGCRVLLLEDSAVEQDFIRQTLQALAAEVEVADKVADAASMARTGYYDMVFASLDLKAEDGLQICAQLRTHDTTRQLPILLLANDNDMIKVSKGLDLGANDYLLRPLDANELVARTRTQLKHKRHYDFLRRNYESSLTLALVDPLTGAFNRRYLDAHLPRMLGRTNSTTKPLAVLMIDIDHFKKVNDTYGHGSGDIVLKTTVDRISNGVRPSDLVARMGGEEFVVIMPETQLEAAHSIADRLRERIAQTPIPLPGFPEPLTITISIGCASIDRDQDSTVEALLGRADAALYKAKGTGRNRVISDVGEGVSGMADV